jgi:hypothetical protein
MKKMLLVLTFAIVLPFAPLAHASTIIGGTDAQIIGGTDATSASWLTQLWQGLASIIGGTD